MLSPLHKHDTWNITDHNRRYIVAANFIGDKCHKRYLVKVSYNNIKILDEMLIKMLNLKI